MFSKLYTYKEGWEHCPAGPYPSRGIGIGRGSRAISAGRAGTVAILSTISVLSLTFSAIPVNAESTSVVRAVKLGVLAHDVPDLWSGFELEGGRAAINLEVQLRAFGHVLGGALAPVVGGSLALGGDATSSAYAGLRWEIGGSAGLFFGLGFGGAVHDGELRPIRADRKALGSRLLFHIPAEIGWRFANGHAISVFFEHMSNAGLADHNEGLDRLGIRYGVRF